MLIISAFHDYFDHIKAHGIDKTIIYHRKSQTIELPQVRYWSKRSSGYPGITDLTNTKIKGLNGSISRLIIGFCGKLYPVVHVKRPNPIREQSQWDLYDYESTEKFINLVGWKHDESKRFWRNEYRLSNAAESRMFFNSDTWKDLLPLFQLYRVPVFIYGFRDNSKQNLLLNPKLSDYQFAKVKDPFTAFQEISMYLSGVIGVPEKPTVILSDKSKAQKAGLDHPYQFRKEPTKRKQK